MLLGDCPLSRDSRIQHLPMVMLPYETVWKRMEAVAGWTPRRRWECRMFNRELC